MGRRKEDLFMAKDIVKEIRRATRRKFNAEEKIRIVLEGLSRLLSHPVPGKLSDIRD
ncbi:MAG: hypothetical protein QGG73_09635 [Candidatus Hydrogenedentes bacterium]|nr:hypothetical protein [Candidatus Hydrogenedentota bacterium]